MSTIADIGIPDVGSGILQPKFKNRWRVIFANMGGGADSQPVSMQATSIDRPKVNFQRVELHRYNSVAYVASKHNWDTLNMTVEDDVTSTASSVIQAQLQKQQWLIGAEGQWLAAAGEGSLYKYATYLEMLDGNDQVIERWILEGCWINNADYQTLDYSDGEKVTINLTISYDHARQVLGGYRSGPGVALGGASTAR